MIDLLVRLYRFSLRRYPGEFRAEYGDEMVELFERRLRETAREGWGPAAGFLACTAREWLTGLPELRPVDRSAGRGRTTASSSGGWMDDARHAVRSLRREPRFSGLLVGVLGLGIALFVGVFAVVNAYLLRPLPFPEADRIVTVRGTSGAVGWMDVDEIFERAVSWDLDVFILTGDGPAELTNGAWVTADFLDVYGVDPVLGRRFSVTEAAPGGPQVAMISHRLWERRFGGDPGVLGETFRAFTSDRPDHAESFTVVGVLPEDFWYFNEYTDVLVPIRENRAVYVGRLRADVPIDRAVSHLDELTRAGLETVPDDLDVQLIRLQEMHTASVRPRLLLYQSAVVLVLLIACANAAVLLLVRSLRRRRELSVRRALGAGRWRIARQLMTEGLLLALAAGALGALVASLGLGALQDAVPAQLGLSVPGGGSELRLDLFVLAATVGVCALVGAVFGLVPFLATEARSRRVIVGGAGRGGGESSGTRRFRAGMVVTEVALSLALLVGAGLVVRSALHLQDMELGFSPQRLERGAVGLRASDYPTAAASAALHDRLLQQVRALPDVEEAAVVSQPPFAGRPGSWEVEDEAGRTMETRHFRAGENYFRTVGAEVLAGRGFERSDDEGTPLVAVVSRSFAEEFWPGRSPLGERLRWADDPEDAPWATVVGVVNDIVHALDEPTRATVYLSTRQAHSTWVNLMVRLRPGGAPVMPRVEAMLQELDPDAPLSSVGWTGDAVERALGPAQFTGWILAGFSGLSALLALVGLYGVVSYSARQRVREVAIRLALGSGTRGAVRPILREGIVVVLTGVGAGLLAALALARGMASQLAGVSPRDPLTFGVVALGLLVLALLAVWWPTRGAAAVEPMAVLREE